MSPQELTEQDQYDFSVLYGAIFSMSLCSDYTDALQAIIAARGSNYTLNKAKAAEKANDALLAVLIREFTKTMSPENKAITIQAIEKKKKFAYLIFEMDSDDQDRVEGLMRKLKKEKP